MHSPGRSVSAIIGVAPITSYPSSGAQPPRSRYGVENL